jgi:myo-inositol 2-dehydrogenase/D-chiro-inositol 1-dehydrogenase
VTRIGVIGCGKIAEKHLNAYRRLGVEVVVTDIVERGAMIAANYGAAWNPAPEEVIHGAEVDAIDVCTPTPTHCAFITEALRSGKHVFCEKPLARDLAEAEAIERTAAESGRILMVGYLYRFHPAFEFAREIIQGGIIGRPYFATFRLGGRGSHKAWKHRRETGGGAGSEMLVHMLDVALWYFGEVTEAVTLLTDTMVPEREIEGEIVQADAEDVILLRIETASGVRVICQSDLVTPGYMNHFEVQGTNGSLFSSILDYMPTLVYCKEPRGVYDRGQNFFDFPKVDLFVAQLGHFLQRIEGSGDERNSVHDSIGLMKVLDRAMRNHERVT